MTDNKPEQFIPVFVDVKPNEDLRPYSDQTICFVGLLSNSMEGIEGLNQYKRIRTKERKLRAAKKIVDVLESGSLQVDGVALTGKMDGQFVRWACETINQNSAALGAEWEADGSIPTHLNWNGNRYSRNNVLGLCVYASILPIIGLHAATICRDSDVSKIKIALDQLPYCSHRGTLLMNAILDNDIDIREMWNRNHKYGHTFELGVLDSYIDQDSQFQSGKTHPNAILVDWLAASCIAKINPEQLKAEGGFNHPEIAEIAAVWDALKVHGSASLHDLDDPKLIRQVVEHESARTQDN